MSLVEPSDVVARSAAVVDVWPNRTRHELSPEFYSLFLETEINFGGEGGLVADQIWNGDFEALGRDDWSTKGMVGQHDPASSLLRQQRIDANLSDGLAELTDLSEPPPDEASYQPWRSFGGAQVKIIHDSGRNNSHALRIRGIGPSSGVANSGYWGIGLRSGIDQVLRLHAKRSARVGGPTPRLRAELHAWGSKVAEAWLVATSEATHAGWQGYAATLHVGHLPSRGACSSAELRLIVPEGEEATVDLVSLVPSDAVAGLFRRDIFEALAELRPGMMRFPGGNYLEGTGPHTRWEWKRTVGPQRDRNGHFNSAWGYYVSDRLGLFELLTLSEALGSEPLLVVPTGLQLDQLHWGHSRYGEPPVNSSWAQDALDAVEFATAPANKGWGALRAAMGRSAPFRLRRIEVGNEERTDAYPTPDPETGYQGLPRGPRGDFPDADGVYAGRYRAITRALWSQYPELQVIASGQSFSTKGVEQDMSASPCLTGQRCDLWAEHYYREPDAMVDELVGRYDEARYSRSRLPKVFVGEYAAPTWTPWGGESNTLRAAVAEAAFAISLERAADVIKASAFAPVLANARGALWPHTLLKFDSARLVKTPSYYATRMLRASLGTHTIEHKVRGGEGSWHAVASVRRSEGQVVVITVKLANYHRSAQPLEVALHDGARVVAANGTTLTADSRDASNRLGDVKKGEADVVEAVAPCPLRVQRRADGRGVRVHMPAWSVSVVQMELRS